MPMKREEFEARLVAKAQADPAFHEALKKDPKGTLEKELQQIKAGVSLPANLQVHVVEESPSQIYIRVPARADNLTDAELASVSGGAGPGSQVAATGVMQIDVTAVGPGPALIVGGHHVVATAVVVIT